MHVAVIVHPYWGRRSEGTVPPPPSHAYYSTLRAVLQTLHSSAGLITKTRESESIGNWVRINDLYSADGLINEVRGWSRAAQVQAAQVQPLTLFICPTENSRESIQYHNSLAKKLPKTIDSIPTNWNQPNSSIDRSHWVGLDTVIRFFR